MWNEMLYVWSMYMYDRLVYRHTNKVDTSETFVRTVYLCMQHEVKWAENFEYISEVSMLYCKFRVWRMYV